MSGPLLPIGNTPVEEAPLEADLNEQVDISDEELEAAISTICDSFEEEDRPTWDNLTRECRRLVLMWHGFQRLAWDEISKDWKTPQQVAEEDGFNIDPDDFNRNINIYKAYGESIIAASSASVPKVRFFPKDATNPNDIIAAKEYSKAAELIQQHNSMKLLLLKANYIRFNSFYVAFYNFHHESEEYGMTKTPITGVENVQGTEETCSACGYPVTEEDTRNEDGTINCTYCGQTALPNVTPTETQRPVVTGFDEEPKGREIIEAYSPLNVKIAPYAKKIKDTPYLRLEKEIHYSILRAAYPDIREDISPTPDTGLSYRWSRESPWETGNRTGLNTVKKWWLRPESYEVLTTGDALEYLKTNYPKGIYAVFIEDKLAEVNEESMDDHWTITEAPTAETLIADPLGSPLAPVNEMKNDLIDLSMQTIDHGIGETFADPDVVSFDKYRKTEAAPGQLFPAKAPIGKDLSAGFFQIKTATLSKEVPDLDDRLTEYGQLVVGAFPSIYGGFAEGGSKTLGEYQASKNQALQRLTIPWEEINAAWAKVMKKSVISMRETMEENEIMVQPQGNSFTNISVSKTDLMSGDIGHVDTENSDQFPISWPERRDLLIQLLSMKDENINAAIFDPNNAGEVARTIGFQNFHVPGEKDRNKQLWEITELLKNGPTPPIEGPESLGTPGLPQPSMATEEFVDDHIVHIQVLKDWCVSQEGLQARQDNQQGYLNVIAHLMQHIQYATPPPEMNPENPQETEKENPNAARE